MTAALQETEPAQNHPFAAKPYEQRALVAAVESTFALLMRYATQRGVPFIFGEEPPLKYQESRYQGEPPDELSLFARLNSGRYKALELHRALADEIRYVNGTETDRLWRCTLTENTPYHPLADYKITTLRIPRNPASEIAMHETWYVGTGNPYRDPKVAEIPNGQRSPSRSQQVLGKLGAGLLYAATHTPVEQVIFTEPLEFDWQEYTFARQGSEIARTVLGELLDLTDA